MTPIESGATTLGWDEEYRAANPLQLSPGPDNINMHGKDEFGEELQLEQVIDPDLIGLTHTGQKISPTVQIKKKQPTKAKGQSGKKKSNKSVMQPCAKNPSVIPDEVEPIATVEKP